jgi:ectoine hydroxylase
MVSLKGAPGTAVFFHCNLVHGSMANITPFRRAIAFATYSSVDIPFRPVERLRPGFVADRTGKAVTPVDDASLLAAV